MLVDNMDTKSEYESILQITGLTDYDRKLIHDEYCKQYNKTEFKSKSLQNKLTDFKSSVQHKLSNKELDELNEIIKEAGN